MNELEQSYRLTVIENGVEVRQELITSSALSLFVAGMNQRNILDLEAATKLLHDLETNGTITIRPGRTDADCLVIERLRH